MRQIVEGVCLAHGVKGTVEYHTAFPATINDAATTATAVSAARSLLGEQSVNGECEPKLFSEDFAHMADRWVMAPREVIAGRCTRQTTTSTMSC